MAVGITIMIMKSLIGYQVYKRLINDESIQKDLVLFLHKTKNQFEGNVYFFSLNQLSFLQIQSEMVYAESGWNITLSCHITGNPVPSMR